MEGVRALVQGPEIEPLTVAEAKDWAVISTAADDELVEGMIPAARAHVEEIAGLALITQTWDYFLDRFPRQIDLPRPPLQSVASIKYIDGAGQLQTLQASEYTVDTKRRPARIVPAYGKSWPTTRTVPNAVEIRYVAGYGDAIEDVPTDLRQAIAVLVATMYEHRERLAEGQLHEVPGAFWQLVNQHRIWWL